MKKYYLINSLERGGAERVIANLLKKEIDQHELFLITLKWWISYSIPKQVTHIQLSKIQNHWLLFLWIPLFVWKLRKVLRQYDLREGISFLEISNFVHILAKKDAVISFRTNIEFFSGWIGKIYVLLIKILYQKAKKIYVNSYENQYLFSHFLQLHHKKVDVMYNILDYDEIQRLRYEKIEPELLNLLEAKRVFITVGSVRRPQDMGTKNHHRIIQAFKQVLEFDTNFIWLIVWDGPWMVGFQAMVQDAWLEKHVVFLWVQKNVFKYLEVSDYFVYASPNEGFPNVLLEAKEIGLPIITSDFKTWAHEIVIWKFDKNLIIEDYPYYWEAWILLNLEYFEEQFLSVYRKKIMKNNS